MRLLRAVDYDYLGNWKDRAGTSNIEVELLTRNLRARDYDEVLISKAVAKLRKAAAIGAGRDLYEANYAVYDLLRYGAKSRAAWASRTRRSISSTGMTRRPTILR